MKAVFKWSPKSEEELEDTLIRHQFDFRTAARAFAKLINKNDPQKFYEIDVKTLQLRWTDIEIRKYRLNTMPQEEPEQA